MSSPLEEAVRSGADKARLKLVCAADVAPEEMRWLWRGFLPFGKLVSLDGAPGVGKSTVATDLIARATRGWPMPGETTGAPPIVAMIAGVEDGWADTLRPRLDAADADLSRVQFVQASETGEGFTLPRDVRELAEHAAEHGAQWLHIDAMMGCLSEEVDAYRDHEVRRALGPLKDAAEAAGLLVTFIRHPRKQGGSGVYAGGGSLAFSALSRGVLFLGFDPSDDTTDEAMKRRVLAVAKMNGAPKTASRSFQVVGSANGASHIAWGDTCSASADDLAAPAPTLTVRRSNPGERPPTSEESFLRELLGDGAPVPCDTVKASAHKAGLKWGTVDKAAGRIGVSRKRRGFKGGSVWYLPQLPRDEASEEPDEASFPSFPPPLAHRAGNDGNGGE